MIVITILNLSVKGRGAASMPKYRRKSLLKVPKQKRKNGPDIAFNVDGKFLILSINFYSFLTGDDHIIKCFDKESKKP